jgi:hypothetical protein
MGAGMGQFGPNNQLPGGFGPGPMPGQMAGQMQNWQMQPGQMQPGQMPGGGQMMPGQMPGGGQFGPQPGQMAGMPGQGQQQQFDPNQRIQQQMGGMFNQPMGGGYFGGG